MTNTAPLATNPRSLFIAAIAAGLTISAIAVVPAPAHAAAAPTSVVAWQTNVEKQIDKNLRTPTNALVTRDHATAEVFIRFNADGQAGAVTLGKSSGDRAADAEALRTARAVRYPVLPTELRGRERTIAMQVYFADSPSSQHDQEANDLRLAAHRSAEQMSVQTAALETK
jgi:TonB family protein